ncbi:MAG: formate/nitrite transporter family protein [Candidatus Bipolaricaulota bacterium]|nr:formate/nitrite transporter family protein [Candidatus Bipolaricaulota bacterium]
MAEFDCKTPATIADTLTRTVCIKKTQESALRLTILGIFAGVYIGFGAQLAIMVTHDMASFLGVGMAKLMGGAMFSVGLMLVVIAGAELFTGNNLIFLSVLDRKVGMRRLLRSWGIVYFANLAGSLLLVLLMYWSDLWKADGGLVGAKALSIANGKVNLTFLAAFARGILCNWLVCLAVWMAFSARAVVGKIFAIFFPIMAFVASGFEHSVANMFFIPMGLVLKGHVAIVSAAGLVDKLSHLTVGGMVMNLISVTLGNIIGGAFFVATLYWIVYLRKGKNT